MIVVLVLLVVILLYVLLDCLNIAYQRTLYAAIPSPPIDSFYAGHLTTIRKARKVNGYQDLVLEWKKMCGPTYMIFSKIKYILFTVEPAMVKYLAQNIATFRKLDDLPNRCLFGQRIAGWDSMLTANAETWAMKRKVMSKFFLKSNMENLFGGCRVWLERHVRVGLKKEVGAGKVLDLLDVLGEIFEGYPSVMGVTQCYEPDVITDRVNMILRVVSKQLGHWLEPHIIKFMLSAEKKEAENKIFQMRKDILHLLETSEAHKMRSEDAQLESATDLISYFVKANKACGFTEAVLYERVVDDIMTLYLVMDNMVKQIGTMFIYLADCPEVYEKMAEELRATELEDFGCLSKLRYTEQVILESLRLAPALQRGTRLNVSADKKQSKVGQYMLPYKTQIHFFTYAIHHDEQYWPNPETFDPERWGNNFSPPPYTYMPFFAGPRGCLGKHFAMMSMKLTLSVLFRNFDFPPKFGAQKPTLDKGMAVTRIHRKVLCDFIPLIL